MAQEKGLHAKSGIPRAQLVTALLRQLVRGDEPGPPSPEAIAPIVAAPSVPQATDVLPQPAEVSPNPPVAAPPAIDPAAPRRRSRRHAQTEPVSYNENDPAPIDREIDLLESLPP